MKIIRNIGNDRVYDELRSSLAPPSSLDLASPVFSLFAYAELRDVLDKIDASARDLFTLYGGWHDRPVALEAARITGSFSLPDLDERASALQGHLGEHARLEREIATRRSQASKEKQLNRRVQLNLEIKELESKLATITAKL